MSAVFDSLVINTIRTLSIDAVQKANSGHPGAPMGDAPIAYLLYDRFLRFNPTNPNWPNRDRFVLSVGHASMLLYSSLHLFGYDLPLEDLKNFRQLDSKCAGHPEFGLAPGVETTTGPLGQGAATSVGMAMAERWLADRFNTDNNKLIDYNIYALLGDGCMMEGITSEAASMAGHLGLSNLIWIYDSNQITIEGKTDLAFTENVKLRFEAYNWNVVEVDDVNDLASLDHGIKTAIDEPDRPSLVIVKTHIAFGAPNKQDTASAHGAPLGDDEVAAAKKSYGWDPEKKFVIPDEIEGYRDTIKKRGQKLEADWQKQLAKLSPEASAEFDMITSGNIPDNWDDNLPGYTVNDKPIATRSVNGQILNAVAGNIPWLLGGSADLGPSNNTVIKKADSFLKSQPHGRNIHFGVREHAMGAMATGMSLSGLRAYAATFLIFSDYMRTSVRLAALMNQPTLYFFTHDSIGVGEDGPTHQPIEQLASLRAMPNLDLIRPADATELLSLWSYIIKVTDHPVALALSRQNLLVIDRTKYVGAENATKGGYIIADSGSTPDVILIGTGSEISQCLEAYESLTESGLAVRVVSLPCWSLFERQPEKYCEEVLPSEVTCRVSIEAGSTLGWERYIGLKGVAMGIDHFGESAPASKLYEKFGLTTKRLIDTVKSLISKQSDKVLDN